MTGEGVRDRDPGSPTGADGSSSGGGRPGGICKTSAVDRSSDQATWVYNTRIIEERSGEVMNIF